MIDAQKATAEFDDQFSLKWGNFEKCISTEFKRIQTDSDLVDITFICDGESFGAHKLVLFACSSYFKTILKANPCPHPIFYMNGVKQSVLKALLDFMYLGEVRINQSDLESFLTVADQFKIRGVSKDSESPSNSESMKSSLDVLNEIQRPIKHKRPRISTEKLAETIRQKTNIMDIIEPKSERTENQDSSCQPEFTSLNTSSGFADGGTMESNSRMFIHSGYDGSSANPPSNQSQCEETTWSEDSKPFSLPGEQETKFKQKQSKLQCLVPSSCPICGRLYSNISNLRQHMRLIHNPTSVVCPICQKCFNSDLYLKRHYLSMHSTTPEKPLATTSNSNTNTSTSNSNPNTSANQMAFTSDAYQKRQQHTMPHMPETSTASTPAPPPPVQQPTNTGHIKGPINQPWNPYEHNVNNSMNMD